MNLPTDGDADHLGTERNFNILTDISNIQY